MQISTTFSLYRSESSADPILSWAGGGGCQTTPVPALSIPTKHGNAIASVVATLDIVDAKRQQFPPKAGITTTFAYIGNFIALAGVIWVAEGIFPLALWLYTFWFLIRLQDQAAKPAPARAKLNGTGRDHSGQTSKRRGRRSPKPSNNTPKNLNGGHHAD